MQSALDYQYDSVVALLTGSSNEEKIAGIILANQYFSEPNIIDPAKKLSTIIKAVTPNFIVRMLQTTTLIDDTNLVQPAGANLLSLACQHKKVLLQFREELSLLIYSMFACNDKENIKNCIIATIKGLLSIVNDDMVTEALNTLLSEYCGFVTLINPLEVLELFTFMLDSIKGTEFTFSLYANGAIVLRSLFVQVFHGAAPETIRDKALGLCSTILNKTNILLPDWTIKCSNPLTESVEIPVPTSIPMNENFPIFLCSIIRGELHLLCEELISLSSTTLTNPQAVDVLIGRSKSNDIAKSRSYSSESMEATDETVKSSPNDKQIEIDRRILARLTRCTAVHKTCMSLLDAILVLLLGNEKSEEQLDENGEAKESVISVWSRLPYQQLLEVKKIIDNTIKELFEFIKDCSNSLVTIAASSGSNEIRYVMSKTQLRDLVCRTVLTVSGFVSEDDDLVVAFIDYLPYVMRCSSMVSNSKSSSSNNNKEVSIGMSFVNKICAAGDVLQYVLPIILSMIHALGSEDKDRKLLDRLYNTLDIIMGAAVNMLSALLSTLRELMFHEIAVSEDIKNGHSPMKPLPGVVNTRLALNAGINVSVVAMDLLLCIFEWKDTDLQTLLRSEGASAYHSIVFVEADQMKKMYLTMKSGWTCIHEFIALLEKELEVLANEGDKRNVETEQETIDLLCSVEQYQTSMRAVAKQLHLYSKLTGGA